MEFYICLVDLRMTKIKYNRIKTALTEGDKQNSELAEFMNVHVTTVSDWCTNTNQPSILLDKEFHEQNYQIISDDTSIKPMTLFRSAISRSQNNLNDLDV